MPDGVDSGSRCRRRIPRIWLLPSLALGLLAALGAAGWFTLSAQRAERLRREQVEDGARLLLVQRIAADADHAVRRARRAAERLASEAWVRASFAAPIAGERRSVSDRLVDAAGLIGAAAIRLRDPSGRVLVGTDDGEGDPTAVGPRSLEEKAAIALHVPVTDQRGAIHGELVVLVPVDAVFDELPAGILGGPSVNAMDGRVVADSEGTRKGVVLDAVSTPATRQSLQEAGITRSAPGSRAVAFALVPSVPLLVSIAEQTPEAGTAGNAAPPIVGALLVFAGLGSLVWGMRVRRRSVHSRGRRLAERNPDASPAEGRSSRRA